MTVAPLHALALAAPDVLARLTSAELALLASMPGLALRNDQRLPAGDWRSCGFVCGRGFGKTYGIACALNERVARGELRAPALIAPTLDRVGEIQVPVIVETSPAWCRAEPYAKGVRWANGVVASPRTSELERPSSGDNFDFVWMTELVRWNATTRIAAWQDITTACRVGRAQYVWDTTSLGKNDLIAALIAQHEVDAGAHRMIRGTTYDNPALTRAYVLDEVRKYGYETRRYYEEIEGRVFSSSSGAAWEDSAWIETYRVSAWPSSPSVVVLGLDPALSGEIWADEVGLCKGALAGSHIYLTDLSARMSPEQYAQAVIRECQRDASGVVVERNHVGQHARDLIKVHAELARMRIEVLPRDDTRPFPARRPGVIFIREVVSHEAKSSRAAPAAALAARGLVHHVGHQPALEHQMLTHTDGGRSPNRLDAAVFVIAELGGVRVERREGGRDVDAAAALSSRLVGGGGGRRLGL